MSEERCSVSVLTRCHCNFISRVKNMSEKEKKNGEEFIKMYISALNKHQTRVKRICSARFIRFGYKRNMKMNGQTINSNFSGVTMCTLGECVCV